MVGTGTHDYSISRSLYPSRTLGPISPRPLVLETHHPGVQVAQLRELQKVQMPLTHMLPSLHAEPFGEQARPALASGSSAIAGRVSRNTVSAAKRAAFVAFAIVRSIGTTLPVTRPAAAAWPFDNPGYRIP